ncbi:MAG: ester cyclase [Chloroflexi bacterium]|nr:ester cyclase [Chloroflexota bacterium]
MSRDENKEMARAFVENVVNGGRDPEGYVTADFIFHFPGVAAPLDLEGWKESYAPFAAAFPDLHATVEDVIAEDDRVAARLVSRGTHRDAFQGVPATGKRIEMSSMAMWRVRDGKIAEHWINLDALGLLQQLGAMPAAAPA